MTITIKVWQLAVALVLVLGTQLAVLAIPVFSQSTFKQQDPEVKECILVNTAKSIEIRYCENDLGSPYYISSLSFMLPDAN
jgi:hypothetical protein